jgi:hypothetical protein
MSSSSESVFGSFPTGSYSVAGLTLKLKSDDSAKDDRQAAVARRGQEANKKMAAMNRISEPPM